MTAIEREDLKSIVLFVCEKYSITEKDLKSQLRNQRLEIIRNDFYYICKWYIHDIGDIAKYVNRNRSSVWQEIKSYNNKSILEEYIKWRNL